MAVACAPLAAGGWEAGTGLALGGLFTEAELAAADLLVQLGGSGGGGDEAPSESGSPRSVNTCAGGAAAWEEEQEEAGGLELDRRTRKRYRLVSELYGATRPVAGAGAGSARKRKRGHGPQAQAEMTMRYGDQSFLGF